MAILQASILRGGKHDTLAVLGGSRWRLVEVEDALGGLVSTILVAKL